MSQDQETHRDLGLGDAGSSPANSQAGPDLTVLLSSAGRTFHANWVTLRRCRARGFWRPYRSDRW